MVKRRRQRDIGVGDENVRRNDTQVGDFGGMGRVAACAQGWSYRSFGVLGAAGSFSGVLWTS